MHIAIAGNIGSGKTTLTKMLAAHYGWTPKFESVDYNPYLADFYEDMERWSFNLQVYFLNKRFKDVVDKESRKRGVRMAKANNTELKVLPLLEPIVEANGLELVDLEFVKEGVNWYLRVYIDKDGGVNIDDCELVSRALEAKLDEKDPIEQAYILEVSSPGIDRPLKKEADFVKYQGEIIDVKLYKAVNGSKQYQGKLLGLENGVLSIEEENGNVVAFEYKDTASVRLAVIF